MNGDTTDQATVGWIGLGRMGAPMLGRLIERGVNVRLWARHPDTVTIAGAQRCNSPEDLARQCDVVVTIVGGPDDVFELQRRMLPQARAGSIYIDMTTAAPATARASQALAAGRDIALLDAPVTGGVAGARDGTLTCLLGGDEAVIARCRPLLEMLARHIVHCGAAGAGYRMKLINQSMIAGTFLGLASGVRLARAGGFDAAAISAALGQGTAAGALFQSYVPRMVDGSGAVTFTLALLLKDLRLARAEAIDGGLSLPLLDCAIGELEEAIARHGADAGVQMLA